MIIISIRIIKKKYIKIGKTTAFNINQLYLQCIKMLHIFNITKIKYLHYTFQYMTCFPIVYLSY